MNDPQIMSATQSVYLKKIKNDRKSTLIFRILILLIFLAVWEFSARFHIIDSFIFSSPSLIAKTMWHMILDKTLFLHTGITLWETLVSFFLVTILSLGIAVLLWLFPKLSDILEPYLVVLNSLPKSALAPLLIVWLGSNMRTIIVAGVSVAIFGAIINLYTGFCETDSDKTKLIYTLGGTKRDALFKVILPSSIPMTLGIMKVNIGLCLVGVVIGEFIGSRQGLGYLIIYSSQVFRYKGTL